MRYDFACADLREIFTQTPLCRPCVPGTTPLYILGSALKLPRLPSVAAHDTCCQYTGELLQYRSAIFDNVFSKFTFIAISTLNFRNESNVP